MLSLVADYSSDSDESTEETISPQSTEPAEKPKLPSANLLFESSAGGKPGEVFSNPYKQAEQAKIALLERHVKMVNSDEHLKMKNGKKICWNYRKGRCRFGSNCSFAHDSDLNESPTLGGENNKEAIKDAGGKQDKTLPAATKIPQRLYGGIQPINESFNTPPEESTTTISAKKRNRPGLSETVVPSKRVLKAYSHQKQNSVNYSQRKLT
ncbi:uncharacterized protein LOC129907255 [Episyrphus balteatus]|uniref:uncharacterized protein LOC129907255 n=1 Tax=Episyrphus balteatus TaxID=286459 RepID=UPI0024862E63|nr:uncharacterized protein LOC129907255 [Episyrphus balteatus]